MFENNDIDHSFIFSKYLLPVMFRILKALFLHMFINYNLYSRIIQIRLFD